MDVQKKLDEIVRTVGSARSMPMSASCVVNRAELLAMLEEVRAALPGSLAEAQELLGGRERMVEEARAEAERIIESANAHRGSLISDTEVARRSQAEADRILAEARREAEEIRAEADDYVDSKLANFEVVLTKTIGSVDRGREKLLGRAPGEDGHEDEDGVRQPEHSADPQTLKERADRYVDAKFGAFEAVLTKTLEAVGRGRQKLQGARPADELGAHLAAQPDGRHPGHTGDAEYLAGLAELADPVPPQSPVPPQPDPQQGYYTDPAYRQQDAYGYPQAPYAQQDPYGYGWPDPQAQQHQQPYDPNAAYLPQHQQAQIPGQAAGGRGAQPAALDETSLFDTSMIDLDRLRQYEEGRQ
ncbi:cell division initiation protein [Streptomyces sp. NPDC018019]|uniref:cell division initiation protein n=1 Tax=Streptomyces sp. NPDC018019 TaxID=3365030 RepID=UPI0037A29B00